MAKEYRFRFDRNVFGIQMGTVAIVANNKKEAKKFAKEALKTLRLHDADHVNSHEIDCEDITGVESICSLEPEDAGKDGE